MNGCNYRHVPEKGSSKEREIEIQKKGLIMNDEKRDDDIAKQLLGNEKKSGDIICCYDGRTCRDRTGGFLIYKIVVCTMISLGL